MKCSVWCTPWVHPVSPVNTWHSSSTELAFNAGNLLWLSFRVTESQHVPIHKTVAANTKRQPLLCQFVWFINALALNAPPTTVPLMLPYWCWRAEVVPLTTRILASLSGKACCTLPTKSSPWTLMFTAPGACPFANSSGRRTSRSARIWVHACICRPWPAHSFFAALPTLAYCGQHCPWPAIASMPHKQWARWRGKANLVSNRLPEQSVHVLWSGAERVCVWTLAPLWCAWGNVPRTQRARCHSIDSHTMSIIFIHGLQPLGLKTASMAHEGR